MRRAWAIAAAGLVWAMAGSAKPAAAPATLEPVIPPGYVPVPSRDESSLWAEMGDYEKELQRSPLLVRDPGLNAYVQKIACRVAGPYCHDVRIYIVRNAGFNASMAPNGMMQVWTGLLTRVDGGDELASILGHETGHYVRAHSINQWRSAKSSLAVGQVFSLGVGLATGVLVPVGESFALLSTLSFSRQQESEADMIGAQMQAKAGFDPHATYQVWDLLIDEEKRAVDHGDSGAQVFKTHPKSEERAKVLREWATAGYGPEVARPVDQEFLAVLQANYRMLMDDQVDTNRFSRTEAILERHAALGVSPGLINFYRGETYRQRGSPGDAELARNAYLAAAASSGAPPEVFRDLGYLYVKAHDMAGARENFRKYLQAEPEASDKAMIEFYLEDEAP